MLVPQNKVWLSLTSLIGRLVSGKRAKSRCYILTPAGCPFFCPSRPSLRRRKNKTENAARIQEQRNDTETTAPREDLTRFVHQGSSFTFKVGGW